MRIASLVKHVNAVTAEHDAVLRTLLGETETAATTSTLAPADAGLLRRLGPFAALTVAAAVTLVAIRRYERGNQGRRKRMLSRRWWEQRRPLLRHHA